MPFKALFHYTVSLHMVQLDMVQSGWLSITPWYLLIILKTGLSVGKGSITHFKSQKRCCLNISELVIHNERQIFHVGKGPGHEAS